MRAVESVCRGRGARLTPGRRQVLEILASSHRPLGAYDILDRMPPVAGSGRRPAPVTVYRILEFFQELGLVHRLASRNAFFLCSLSRHAGSVQLWHCRRCGSVAETAAEDLTLALPTLAEQMGFRIAGTTVEIEGDCPACRQS